MRAAEEVRKIGEMRAKQLTYELYESFAYHLQQLDKDLDVTSTGMEEEEFTA